MVASWKACFGHRAGVDVCLLWSLQHYLTPSLLVEYHVPSTIGSPGVNEKLMREALDLVQSRIVAQANEMRAGAEDSREQEGGFDTRRPGCGGASAEGWGGSARGERGWKGRPAGAPGSSRLPTVKANAHVRITHLPPLSDLCKPNISSIRGTDLGSLIQIQVSLRAVLSVVTAEREPVIQARDGH